MNIVRHIKRILRMQQSYKEDPCEGFCHKDDPATLGRPPAKEKSEFGVRVTPRQPK
jgi:hypothetical protein